MGLQALDSYLIHLRNPGFKFNYCSFQASSSNSDLASSVRLRPESFHFAVESFGLGGMLSAFCALNFELWLLGGRISAGGHQHHHDGKVESISKGFVLSTLA